MTSKPSSLRKRSAGWVSIRSQDPRKLPRSQILVLLVMTSVLLLTLPFFSSCGFFPSRETQNSVPKDWDPAADDNLVTPGPKEPGYREEDVVLGEGDWAVKGKLCLPEMDFFAEPYPVVVLVSGSGPNDMDSTLYASKLFFDLAHGLAERGVATLRYNKITKENEKLIKSIEDTLTLNDEYLPNAKAALAFLSSEPRILSDRVFVLGHSLGGSIIPRVNAVETLPAGYILMAAGNIFLADELLRQYDYLFNLDGKVDEQETATLAQVEEQQGILREMLDGTRAPKGSVLGAPYSYWADLHQNPPLETAATLTKPVLILQGGRDYNVLPYNADRWEQALADNPDVQRKDYPTLNHQFLHGEGPDDPVNLLTPATVPPEPIQDIADWVLSR